MSTNKNTLNKLITLLRRKQLVEIPKVVNAPRILEGKIVLITGGSSGIGFAFAKKFIEVGAKVIIAGTNEEKLKKCLDEIENKDSVRTLVLNVLEVPSLPGKVAEALNLFPEHRIDILVNSAGVRNELGFLTTTEEDYDHVMDVNMKGTFFMSQAIAKYMIENKIKGHILNLASSSSKRPAWNAYQVSKWGVRGFTTGLADTLSEYGIVVNAIAPGPVATPFMGFHDGGNCTLEKQPMHRYAYPKEIAELAAFMISDLGNLIIGDTFFISGGSGVTTLHG